MLRNRHVITALLVAPILAVLAWFAVGNLVGELYGHEASVSLGGIDGLIGTRTVNQFERCIFEVRIWHRVGSWDLAFALGVF